MGSTGGVRRNYVVNCVAPKGIVFLVSVGFFTSLLTVQALDEATRATGNIAGNIAFCSDT